MRSESEKKTATFWIRMIWYCGRLERVLKRFLMLIGVFSVLYVITYNYHLMTVNIVSKDPAYLQDKILEGAEIDVSLHHKLLTQTTIRPQPPKTTIPNTGQTEKPVQPDEDKSHVLTNNIYLHPNSDNTQELTQMIDLINKARGLVKMSNRHNDKVEENVNKEKEDRSMYAERLDPSKTNMASEKSHIEGNAKNPEQEAIKMAKAHETKALGNNNGKPHLPVLGGKDGGQAVRDEKILPPLEETKDRVVAPGGSQLKEDSDTIVKKPKIEETEVTNTTSASTNEEEGRDEDAETLAIEDPNHPGAEMPPEENADIGQDGYEGGNEDDVMDIENDPNAVAPEKNVKANSGNSRGNEKRVNSRQGANPVPAENAEEELIVLSSFGLKKLKILEEKISDLARRIANETFTYGRPPKSQSKHTCTRYKKEARIKSRYNVTNIWSNVNTINSSDVTFVTQMTTKRMKVLHRVAKHWSGPINVAIYAKHEELSLIAEKLQESRLLLNRDNIELHVVIESGEFYPVNYLRNVALNHSVTDYVYLSDVDFVPSAGLHENLQGRINQGLLHNRTVLVIPGFQFKRDPGSNFPRDKSQLLHLWKKKKVQPFHWYFRFGHRATNFGKWRKSTEPYYIKWEDGFEPYILGKRKELPPYSQKFLSRVRNKTFHITQIYYMGFWFKVLPDVFTIHMPHAVSKDKTYYYWCSANEYVGLKRRLSKKYPAKKYRNRGSPLN